MRRGAPSLARLAGLDTIYIETDDTAARQDRPNRTGSEDGRLTRDERSKIEF